MQHHSLKTIWALLLIGIVTITQSFTSPAGGEGFEIYLNNKLLFWQPVGKPFTLHNLQLDKANKNDQLVIYYHHCGYNGNNRVIALKDDKGNTIKEWKFADATQSNRGMTIAVKELLQLEKNYSNANLNIVYYAQQLPKGRALSAIQINGKSTTKLDKKDSWPVWTVVFSR